MHYKYMILNGFQKYLSSRHNKNIAGQEYIYIKETMYNFKELQSNDTHYTYKLKTCDQKLLTDYGSTLNKSI